MAPETVSEYTHQYSIIYSQSMQDVLSGKFPPDANARKNIINAIFEVTKDPYPPNCKIETMQEKTKVYWYPVKGTNPQYWISYLVMDSMIIFLTPTWFVDFKLQ